MPAVEKNCENPKCKKWFLASRPNVLYCCSECRIAVNQKAANERLKQETSKPKMDKPPKKKRKGKSIAQISKDARKLGLTYGQYVAKMGL